MINGHALLPTELWSINCIYIYINDSYWILDSMLLIDLRLTSSCPELWFSHQEDKSELQGATSNFLSWITLKPEKDWLPPAFTYHSEYIFMTLIHGSCGFQVRSYHLTVLGYLHHQLMLYSDFSASRQMRIIDFLQLAASMSLDLVVDQRWLYEILITDDLLLTMRNVPLILAVLAHQLTLEAPLRLYPLLHMNHFICKD